MANISIKRVLSSVLFLVALTAYADDQQLKMALPGPLSIQPVLIERQVAPSVVESNFEGRVMEIVNMERWVNGQLAPLKRNNLLDQSSETHSNNMAIREFFAHCDVDTKTMPWDRMSNAGYVWNVAAENIAAGFSTPEAVMQAWMESPGHRANILATNARELGVGYVNQANDTGNVRGDENGDCNADQFNQGPFFTYWTQNFGRRNNLFPVVINREALLTQVRTVELYVYGEGWATEMRIRNEDSDWTPWQGFATNIFDWSLSAGNGIKQVTIEIRNSTGTVLSASDNIELEQLEERVSIQLQKGFNLFAYPVSVAVEHSTCSGLLRALSDAGDVIEVSRFNPGTQVFESCDFDGGQDFPIVLGEAYVVQMKRTKTVEFVGTRSCVNVQVFDGMNLIGYPAAADTTSCIGLLSDLGSERVGSILRFDQRTGRFETCQFENGMAFGADFPLVAGEAYIVFAVQDAESAFPGCR